MSLAQKLDAVSSSGLRQLHRGVISDPAEIVLLLETACRDQVDLHNGVDRKSEPRVAQISAVTASELVVRAPNLRAQGQSQLYLHFNLAATRYFFAAPPISGGGSELLRLDLPSAVYEAERRDLLREPVSSASSSAPLVMLRGESGMQIEGRLRDWSYQGMGVAVRGRDAALLDDRCIAEVWDGKYAGESRFAVVRRREPESGGSTWTRLGLEASRISHTPPFQVERRERILDGGIARQAWRKVALAGAIAKRLPSSVLMFVP